MDIPGDLGKQCNHPYASQVRSCLEVPNLWFDWYMIHNRARLFHALQKTNQHCIRQMSTSNRALQELLRKPWKPQLGYMLWLLYPPDKRRFDLEVQRLGSSIWECEILTLLWDNKNYHNSVD